MTSIRFRLHTYLLIHPCSSFGLHFLCQRERESNRKMRNGRIEPVSRLCNTHYMMMMMMANERKGSKRKAHKEKKMVSKLIKCTAKSASTISAESYKLNQRLFSSTSQDDDVHIHVWMQPNVHFCAKRGIIYQRMISKACQTSSSLGCALWSKSSQQLLA